MLLSLPPGTLEQSSSVASPSSSQSPPSGRPTTLESFDSIGKSHDDGDKNKKRAKKIQDEKEKRKRSYRTVKRRSTRDDARDDSPTHQHQAQPHSHDGVTRQSAPPLTMAALGTAATGVAPGQVERIYRLSPTHKSITHTMMSSTRKDAGNENPATQNKRYRIIRELLDTERSYVTSLQTAVTVFVDKMRRLVGTPNEVASPDEIDLMFGNIKEIAQISISVLQELRIRTHSASWTPESCIGDFFIELLDKVLSHSLASSSSQLGVLVMHMVFL